MWCRSIRRDSHPGNRHRHWSRSRAARRSAAVGRRRRRPRSSTLPSRSWSIQLKRGGAGDHLGGADTDCGSVVHVAPRRVGRVAWHRPRGGRRFRGNAGWRLARLPVCVGRIALGQGVGADVHDDLVHLGVIGSGDLAAHECLRDDQQGVGQARRCLHARLISGRRFRGDAIPAAVMRVVGVVQVARRPRAAPAAAPRPAAEGAGRCRPATRRPRTARSAAAGSEPPRRRRG